MVSLGSAASWCVDQESMAMLQARWAWVLQGSFSIVDGGGGQWGTILQQRPDQILIIIVTTSEFLGTVK